MRMARLFWPRRTFCSVPAVVPPQRATLPDDRADGGYTYWYANQNGEISNSQCKLNHIQRSQAAKPDRGAFGTGGNEGEPGPIRRDGEGLPHDRRLENRAGGHGELEFHRLGRGLHGRPVQCKIKERGGEYGNRWAGSQPQYLSQFPVIEIQSTFYDPPASNVAARWRTIAPSEFEFCIKAWQLITHAPSSPTYRRLGRPIDAERSPFFGSFQDTDESGRHG